MARKYARDNRGRFASRGGGATARGGRLKTASGKKRATQTMQASAAPKGTIGKPKGLRPGAIKAKAAANKVSASPRQLTGDQKIARDVMSDKRFRSDRQRVAEMQRRGVKANTDFVSLVADVRAKQGGGTTAKIKPAAKNASRAAAARATKPAPKVDTSLKGVAARRARALAPRTSTYLSQKLNTQSAITRSAANAIYNRQRAVGKQLGLDTSVVRNPIGIMPKASGSIRNMAMQVREAARKRVVGGRRR